MRKKNEVLTLTISTISPIVIILFGLVAYLFIYFLAPIDYVKNESYDGLLYIASSLVVFCVGVVLSKSSILGKTIEVNILTSKVKKVANITLIIACLGIVLRVVDRYYYGGMSISNDFYTNRIAFSESSGSVASTVAAVTLPFCFFVPFVFYIYSKISKFQILKKVLIVFVSLFPVLDGLVLGSRSSAILFFGFTLLYVLLARKYLFNKKFLFLSFSLLLLSIMVSGMVFDVRTSGLGMSTIESTQYSAYSKFGKLESDAVESLKRDLDSSKYIYSLRVGVYNFSQYYTHGVSEFFYLFDNFNSSHTFGVWNFYDFAKLIRQVYDFGNPGLIIDRAVPRSGVFTTFLGPVFVDFGWGGLLFIAFFGYFFGSVTGGIERGYIALVPLYSFFCIIVFFSPVVSYLVAAQGGGKLVAAFVFWIIARNMTWRGVVSKL